MTRLLSLLLLLPSLALGADDDMSGWLRKPTSLALSMPFDVPGCYASGSSLGTKGETLTFTRSSSRTCNVGGSLVTCTANQACVESDGLLTEPARTNYVLQSGTHPKTAEATGSLPTGAGVCWHDGTGTLTVVAGSATVTGLSCSAVASGTVCPFTVTVGGTLSVTTTSGTTRAQCEIGAYRTSYIPTTTTAAARSMEYASLTHPLTATEWCIDAVVTLAPVDRWRDSDTLQIWRFGSGSNAVGLALSGSALSYSTWDASNVKKQWDYARSSLALSAHRLAVSYFYAAHSATMAVDGASVEPTKSGAGSAPSSLAAVLWPEHALGSYPVGGHIRDLRLYRRSTCR